MQREMNKTVLALAMVLMAVVAVTRCGLKSTSGG